MMIGRVRVLLLLRRRSLSGMADIEVITKKAEQSNQSKSRKVNRRFERFVELC